MHTLKQIDSLVLFKGQKISEAIKKINDSKIKILFVLDSNKKLIGSISSGDLRRCIRKKTNPNVRVEKIMFKKVKFFYQKHEKSITEKSFTRSIFCLPVVKSNKVLKYVKLAKETKETKEKNTIFLMAGGKGLRLYPLTKNTPKPLLKIKNKTIIEKIITDFRDQGFSNFVISVNYLGDKIKNYLGSGKKFKVSINYINERSFLGTAGSLSKLKIENLESPIIVANSDLISKIDYKNLLNYHIKKKSDFTICAKNKVFEMPYGEIVLDKDFVKEIIEKPISTNLVNAGIYVINLDLLRYIKKDTKVMMNDFIGNLIKKNKRVLNYPIYENWIDIGDKIDFYNAKK